MATFQGLSTSFKIIELTTRDRRSYLANCRGSKCFDLPIASYQYALQLDSNNRVIRGTSVFGGRHEWKTVELGSAIGTAGDFEGRDLRGRILGLNQKAGPVWVRLQGIFMSGVMEAPVDERGNFRIARVVGGKWIVIALQGDRILATRILESFAGGGEIVIDLGQKQ